MVAAILCVAAAVPAFAQRSWKPEGPVEIIAPSGPGGGTDQTARLIRKIWQDRQLVDVPVNVVNKSGGGGAMALSYLKQHAGDPHFLQVASAVLLTNQIVGRSTVSYAEFTPIALLNGEYVVLAVRSDAPFKSGKHLIARLKQYPGWPVTTY